MGHIQSKLNGLVNDVLFQPPGPLPSINLSECRKKMKKITLSDSTIYYIYFKTQSVPQYSGDPMTILYSHGNAEDLGSCYANIRLLSNAIGAHIFAYDYCGYGFSKTTHVDKRPNEEQVYRDAEAVYRELTEIHSAPPSRLILMGRSMGGGPTCHLAKKYHSEIGGVILMSTFTSAFGALGCVGRLLKCLPCLRDPFPNEMHLRDAGDCSFLIMHGTKDNVVRFNCSKQLLNTVKKAQKVRLKKDDVTFHWFQGCGHNDIEAREFDTFVKLLTEFFSRVASHHRSQ